MSLDLAETSPRQRLFDERNFGDAFIGGEVQSNPCQFILDVPGDITHFLNFQEVKVWQDNGMNPLRFLIRAFGPNQTNLGNGWACLILGFKLFWINILSPCRDNQFLGPSCQKKIPLRIEIT